MSPELLAGLLVALGLYLVVTSLPFGAPRPTLDEQLARFDVDLRLGQRRQAARARRPLLPWAPADAVLSPLLEDLARPVQRLLRDDGPFGAQLDTWLLLLQPGMRRVDFVVRQLLMGAGGAAVMLIVFTSTGQLGPTALVWIGLAGVVGFLEPYRRLRRAARRRRARILAELPHVARALAIALSAGAPLDRALGQVGRGAGLLSQEIGQAGEMAASRAWRLLDLLAMTAERERVPELTSFIAHLRAADEQGLELGPGLTTLATTLQEQHATRMLAAAEKDSVKMLFPLALVMAPVSLVIALAPNFLALTHMLGR